MLNTVSDKIEPYLSYLSPKKLGWLVIRFINGLESDLFTTFHNNIIIRLFTHLCYLIERLMLKTGSLTSGEISEDYSRNHQQLFVLIRNHLKPIEEVFSITVNQDEVFFLIEIIRDNVSN